MADRKQWQPAVATTLSTAPKQGAGGGIIVPLHHEHAVPIDLERVSADLVLDLTAHDDAEFQSSAGAELQSPFSKAASSTSASGSGSNAGSPLMSRWRWIGQKELQYLVTNRRTPPPRSPPEGPAARATKLGSDAGLSSSAVVRPMVDPPSEALEQGAFLRVVTESGARIPAVLEAAGSEGGRQRIAHILLPTTDESPEQEQSGSPNHSPHPISGGKKRKVSSVVVGENQNSSSLSQDLEMGKVCSGATTGDGAGGAAADATSGYQQHEDDDDSNEPLCRVCHLSTVKADVITLGCACKDDLGRAHRGCAETWFQVKGNRQCEICGEVAQNVQLLESTADSLTNTNTQDSVITVRLHHPATFCWQNRPIRNFLLVFLVAAFLIPWLFRFAYYH